MKKKVLMGLVLLAIIGTSAVFAQTPTLDKLKISTTGYASAANNQISGAVVIPDTYNGKPVVVVNNFTNIAGITSVTFPNSLTKIDTNAFTNCTGIKSITIPASVTIIGNNAFGRNTNLTEVTFQGSSITLGAYSSPAFDGDLDAKYKAGGAGTYTRTAGSNNWTKQGGVAVCPTCGQPLPAGFKLP